jgi:meso-butanediol dehydrogenase/(S,S)-butanediol dehydrogenase/diacetyl reductase
LPSVPASGRELQETIPAAFSDRLFDMTIAPHRLALVTGGASGFGLTIAGRLGDAGARVALLDRDGARLTAAAERLGPGTIAIEADVSCAPQVAAAVERSVRELGGLDTLVVSAGVIHVKDLADVTEQDWDTVLDVNLKGAFLTMQAAAPALRASGRGRIVSIGSDVSKRGCPGIVAYVASKFGLVGITESLAAELARDQVTVNCVCPVGCPTTEMGKALAAWKAQHSGQTVEEVLAAAAAGIPLGRNASEADVAGTAMFLISDDAAFVTGVAIDVDGGAHAMFIPGV